MNPLPLTLALGPYDQTRDVTDGSVPIEGVQLRTLNLPYRFQEPAGLSLAAGALWIANTNAHEIVRVDLGSGQVKRLTIGE